MIKLLQFKKLMTLTSKYQEPQLTNVIHQTVPNKVFKGSIFES